MQLWDVKESPSTRKMDRQKVIRKKRRKQKTVVALSEEDSLRFPSLRIDKCVASAGYSHVYSATMDCKNQNSKQSLKRWCILKVSRNDKSDRNSSSKQAVDRYERAIRREIDAYRSLSMSLKGEEYERYFVKFYADVRLSDEQDTRALLLDCFTHSMPLAKFIRKCDLTVKHGQKVAKAIFRSLLRAVRCCHQAGFAHHDLKPDNILLRCSDNKATSLDSLTMLFGENRHSTDESRQQEVDLRLIDFGLAQPLSEEKCCGPCGGTPAYVAPEVLWHEPHCSARVDVWSLGTILFEMCSGRALYRGNSMGDFRYQMLQLDVVREFDSILALKSADKTTRDGDGAIEEVRQETGDMEANQQFLSDVRALLSPLMALDPKDRCSVNDALASAFMEK